MAQEDFTTARIVNIILGIWLVVSAFLWPHSYAQMNNAWIVGVLCVAFALVAMRVPEARYLNTLLAVWLFISVWALPMRTATHPVEQRHRGHRRLPGLARARVPGAPGLEAVVAALGGGVSLATATTGARAGAREMPRRSRRRRSPSPSRSPPARPASISPPDRRSNRVA